MESSKILDCIQMQMQIDCIQMQINKGGLDIFDYLIKLTLYD